MTLINVKFEEVASHVLDDTATGGQCYNAYITIEEYLRLISDIYIKSNEFQRDIFDIKRNLVYNKLVRDLIKGVVIPTISLYMEDVTQIGITTQVDKENLRILDGLQRTNCIIYAYKLLNEEFIDPEVMSKIKNPLSLEEFLRRLLRVEVWTCLTVNGILYKMVSLNAGQTPMRVDHQFEVLELPLMKELRSQDILVFRKKDEQLRKKQEGFLLSMIVEGVIAYNLEKIFPKKQEMAISFLDRLDIYKKEHESMILKTDIFMEDLLWVLKELHDIQIKKYSTSPEFKGILAEKDTFFIPFMAALGKARHSNSNNIEDRKRALINLLKSEEIDPLELRTFNTIIDNYRAGIGMKIRKLVFNAFNFFFRGSENKIDWHLANDMI